MIYELRKATEAILHPGIRTNLYKLVRNVIPYYISPSVEVPPPLTIYWSINSVCNLRCKMCDVGMMNEDGTFYKNLKIDGKLHDIDINVFKSVVDTVAHDKPFIAIIATEPLLYKNILDAVEYCTRKGLEASVSTGGYKLPEMAEELAVTGLKRLNVSIDGPCHIHNEIRGRRDSYERAIEGIKRFSEVSTQKRLHNEIFVNYTISNLNYQYLKEFTNYLMDLPVKRINFCHLWFISREMAEEQNRQFGDRYPVSESCVSEHINPSVMEIDVLDKQIRELQKIRNIKFLPPFSKDELCRYYKEPDRHMNNVGRCLASWFFIQIIANGDVIPFTRCGNKSLGNIYQQSLMDIWNGKAMKEWRNFIKKEKRMPLCKRCDLIF